MRLRNQRGDLPVRAHNHPGLSRVRFPFGTKGALMKNPMAGFAVRIEALVELRFPGHDQKARKAIRRARTRLKVPEPDVTDALVEALLGASERWHFKGSSATRIPWPREPSLEPAHERRVLRTWLEETASFKQFISLLSESEFESLHNEEWQKSRAFDEQFDAIDDKQRFFNEPRAKADFTYWKSMPVWNAPEATSLSLGKDPRSVNEDTLSEIPPAESIFRREYNRRHEVVVRALEAAKLQDRLTPERFVRLLDTNGIGLPPELLSIIGKKPTVLGDEDASTKGGRNNTINKLSEVLLGIAISKYEFDAIGYREEVGDGVFEQIEGDVKAAGLSASSKTVRKYVLNALEAARAGGQFRDYPHPKSLKGKSSK